MTEDQTEKKISQQDPEYIPGGLMGMIARRTKERNEKIGFRCVTTGTIFLEGNNERLSVVIKLSKADDLETTLKRCLEAFNDKDIGPTIYALLDPLEEGEEGEVIGLRRHSVISRKGDKTGVEVSVDPNVKPIGVIFWGQWGMWGYETKMVVKDEEERERWRETIAVMINQEDAEKRLRLEIPVPRTDQVMVFKIRQYSERA